MSAVAIVGGGLAGGAAATLLAGAGRPVVLYEREAEPADKVCGEFLSGAACAMLEALGLDLARLGARPVTRFRLSARGRTIETALPFVAMGLSRRRLDAALLDHAARRGARIERGATVRSADRLEASALFLATGKHELRGLARDAAGCDTGLVGFKSYWRAPPRLHAALAGAIEVVLFEGGYAGVQCVEGGRVNLCLLVRKARLAALGGTWEALRHALVREPRLAPLLEESEALLPRPLAIAGVPYGFVHRPRPGDRPDLFRLGDQAAVIPSFCGDGMAIALRSGMLAAAAMRAGEDAHAFHAGMARSVRGPIALARAIGRAGERGWTQALILATLGLWPALARPLIRATRVPRARLASPAPAC